MPIHYNEEQQFFFPKHGLEVEQSQIGSGKVPTLCRGFFFVK